MTVSQVFRKYNKQMMVTLVVFLMVSWLASDACYRLSGKGPAQNPLQGTAWDKKIYVQDLHLANTDLHLLSAIGLLQQLMNPQNPHPIAYALSERDTSDLNYYLLLQEVERAGVRPGAEQVAQIKARFGLNDAAIAQLRDQLNMPTQQIEGVVDRLAGVLSLADLVNDSTRVSQPQIDAMIRVTQDKVFGDHVDLPVSAYLDGPEPTQEEMIRHFDQFKNVLPNAQQVNPQQRDPVGFGFGYRQPPRVRIEAMVFDLEPILQVVQSVSPHQDKLLGYYERNKARYVERKPTAGSQPTTAATTRQLSFQEVQDRVLADFQLEDARLRLMKIAAQAREQAFSPWYSLMQPDGTYQDLPREKWVSYQNIAQTVVKDYKVAPEIIRTILVSPAEMAAQYPTLANMLLPPQGPLTQETLLDYSFYVRPLVMNQPGAPIPVLTVGQECKAPLADSPAQPNRMVVFRVIEVQPSEPATNLTTVADQVRRDVRLANAFKRATEAADKLAEAARKVGLAQALVDNPDIYQAVAGSVASTQPASAPVASQAAVTLAEAKSLLIPDEKITYLNERLELAAVPGLPRAAGQEVARAMFAALDKALLATTTQPTTQADRTSDAPLAVSVSPLPSLNRVRVMEVIGVEHAPADVAQKMEGIFRNFLEQQSRMQAMQIWFAPHEIRSRAKFLADPNGRFGPRTNAE